MRTLLKALMLVSCISFANASNLDLSTMPPIQRDIIECPGYCPIDVDKLNETIADIQKSNAKWLADSIKADQEYKIKTETLYKMKMKCNYDITHNEHPFASNISLEDFNRISAEITKRCDEKIANGEIEL